VKKAKPYSMTCDRCSLHVTAPSYEAADARLTLHMAAAHDRECYRCQGLGQVKDRRCWSCLGSGRSRRG